jgi:hypothetical protein
MRIFQKEKAQKGEMAVYEFLNTIADFYNPQFAVLQLPKAAAVDYEKSVIYLPFYEGETFNEKWSESDGGLMFGLDLSVEVPSMLKDLSMIDTELVRKQKKLKQFPKIQFNRSEYLSDLKQLCNRFVDFGLITEPEASQALDLLSEDFTSPLIFNNGDFYPRNFIRMENNKIVLIDWETWNEHSTAYILDHLENVAAYCFVNMWNNEPWQKNYVMELRKLFDVNKKDFQKAILIKAADMAVFWFKTKQQATLNSPMKLFKQALTTEYMDWLWADQ